MSAAGDDFAFSVAVHVQHQHGNARAPSPRRVRKIRVPDPLSFFRVCGSFEPAFGQHNVPTSVSGNVAASEPMPLPAFREDVNRYFAECPRAIALLVGDELVVGHLWVVRRVGQKFDPPIAINVPTARCFDAADFRNDVFRPLF